MDTIFALASAKGKAGVAVVRISGPMALDAAVALCGDAPQPRQASLRKLHHGGVFLDEALVLVFEAGASFTGEAACALQIHGGLATVKAVLAALGAIAGLRMADPGEFSRRALENGRLDLTQIEGLADVIDAETEAQRRQALAVMSGSLGRRVTIWREDLIRGLALLAATIDFSEEDLPDSMLEEVASLVKKVRGDLERELAGAKAAERIRDGFEVAIVGAPNVGKSTLLNALAGREAAITSDVAGTTRDVIEVRLDIHGLAVTLLDTAGLRDAPDEIERIGVSRAMDRARAADLRIFLFEKNEMLPIQPQEEDLVVWAKADLARGGGFSVSGLTGEGLDQLLIAVSDTLSKRVAGSSMIIRERHRTAMLDARQNLDRAIDGLSSGVPVELVSADIEAATRSLEILIGKVGDEDLLGEIFSRFCIGK